MLPDAPYASYASWWDRTFGRQAAYFTGLQAGRAENRDHHGRSLVVAAVGESPNGGSDTRRRVRFSVALSNLYLMVFGHRPDPLSVEAAMHALGIEHHARRREVQS